MRRRLAQGLTMALLVSFGAAQRPTSSGLIQSANQKISQSVVSIPANRHSKPYQVGVASWYGEDFAGKPTASGEPYNMFELTAAHMTLPLGTLVKVTNLKNRRSVVVRVNDRGPVVPGRIIDLSYSAARVLNFKAQGIQRVRLDVVSTPKPLPAIALLREPVLETQP